MTDIEDFAEVTPDMHGRWKIECSGGSWLALIHDPNRLQLARAAGTGARMPRDGEERGLKWVTAWPKLGYHFRVHFNDGSWFTSTPVTRITRLKLPLSQAEQQELKGEA